MLLLAVDKEYALESEMLWITGMRLPGSPPRETNWWNLSWLLLEGEPLTETKVCEIPKAQV